MKGFLARNIDGKGRIARAVMGLALLVGGALSLSASVWLAGVLAAAGVFAIIEALRGWCLFRACGIKTRL